MLNLGELLWIGDAQLRRSGRAAAANRTELP